MAGKSRRALKKAAAKGDINATLQKQGIQVVSWYLVFVSIAVILGGFVLRTSELSFKDWWWVIMSLGIAGLGMSIY